GTPPPPVKATAAAWGPSLPHLDGESASLDDLVRGTLTGRNFGWLPGEAPRAIAQLARVIREDDGSDPLAQAFGALPYRVLLTGTDPSIPAELVLPAGYRLHVAAAGGDAHFSAPPSGICAPPPSPPLRPGTPPD